MSKKDSRDQPNGPRYESSNPAAGCNATHVARARAKWKRRKNRAFRRTRGKSLGGYWGKPGPIFEVDEIEEE